MSKQSIIEFFRSHPEISATAVERKLDMPASTLYKAINGSQMLPDKWLSKLEGYLQSLKNSIPHKKSPE